MNEGRQMKFVRLSDGDVLARNEDGTYSPVQSRTDLRRLAGTSDAEIERIAASDADHPGLDASFWATVSGKHLRSDGAARLRIAAVRRRRRIERLATIRKFG